MSSIDISAMQNVMRAGLNQENELNTLLTYYRNKLDDYAKERLQWLAKFDECKHNAELRHKLEWDNRKLKDRVEELEKALSHHRTALYDERQNYLRLMRENNDLKMRQTMDGQKIQDLLNVCDGNAEDMIMCRDVRPDISNKFIVNQLNIHKHGQSSSTEKYGSAANERVNDKMKQQSTSKQTKKTIPQSGTRGVGDTQTTYELEIINLKKAHEHESLNYLEQIQALKDELQRLQTRYDERQTNQTDEYKQLLRRHTDLEKKHNNLAQQYFSIRMKLNDNEQKTQQQNELLRVKNMALLEKMKEQERRYEREHKAVEELVTKRNNDYKAKYKADMRKKEEHLSILKEQYEKVQQIYLNKIKNLEQTLSSLNDKYNDLLRKSKREGQSLRSQLRVMQRRVEKEQVQKMRLEIQQVQEEERRKQEQEEEEYKKKQEQAEEKKKKRTLQIKKAYQVSSKPKTTPQSKTKKPKPSANMPGRQDRDQIQEQEEEESMNSSDIENIKRHIRQLEAKLELDKNK